MGEKGLGEKDGRTVRWGIVGAGRIAHRFARSLARERRSELVAISCRSAGRAEAFALEHGVPEDGALSDEALGGAAGAAHAALLARPDVDAVYLALPHSMHLEWALAALRAGKAVLCEKPACVDAREARELVRAARETGALLMEAMKTRFSPLYRHVRDLVERGAVGEVRRVEALLENDMGDRIARGGDYLSDARGGGILLDSGIYCASWVEDYLGGPLEVVAAEARWDHGHDCFVDAELARGPLTARLVTAADAAGPRTARIVGSGASSPWRTCTARSAPGWSAPGPRPSTSSSPTPSTTSTTRSRTSSALRSPGEASRTSCPSRRRCAAPSCSTSWGTPSGRRGDRGRPQPPAHAWRPRLIPELPNG
ncbi:Gfo/Idh/MocA family protein [Thermophilibacter provencensis]|uniref:Gfo/Idh/MocA family protein n=1 Tax=Thermophilibacter provencensis TaxID=1852386 RepID=UPI003AA9BB03